MEIQAIAGTVLRRARLMAHEMEVEAIEAGQRPPAEREGAAMRLALEVALRLISAAAARYATGPAGEAVEDAGDALDRAIEAMARADGLPHDAP